MHTNQRIYATILWISILADGHRDIGHGHNLSQPMPSSQVPRFPLTLPDFEEQPIYESQTSRPPNPYDTSENWETGSRSPPTRRGILFPSSGQTKKRARKGLKVSWTDQLEAYDDKRLSINRRRGSPRLPDFAKSPIYEILTPRAANPNLNSDADNWDTGSGSPPLPLKPWSIHRRRGIIGPSLVPTEERLSNDFRDTEPEASDTVDHRIWVRRLESINAQAEYPLVEPEDFLPHQLSSLTPKRAEYRSQSPIGIHSSPSPTSQVKSVPLSSPEETLLSKVRSFFRRHVENGAESEQFEPRKPSVIRNWLRSVRGKVSRGGVR